MSESRKPNVFIAYCKRHSYKPRNVIIFAAVIVLIIVALGVFTLQKSAGISKTTTLSLKNIGELATQAGYFTTVQTITKSRDILGLEIPGTKSNYVYSYDGIIKAGIDFNLVDSEVDETNKIITIKFPEFKIISTEIKDDSFVLYNDGANLFTSLKLQDVDKSNSELKEAARKAAIDNGILEAARANAEILIRGFLASMYDLSVYKVEFISLNGNA